MAIRADSAGIRPSHPTDSRSGRGLFVSLRRCSKILKRTRDLGTFDAWFSGASSERTGGEIIDSCERAA